MPATPTSSARASTAHAESERYTARQGLPSSDGTGAPIRSGRPEAAPLQTSPHQRETFTGFAAIRAPVGLGERNSRGQVRGREDA